MLHAVSAPLSYPGNFIILVLQFKKHVFLSVFRFHKQTIELKGNILLGSLLAWVILVTNTTEPGTNVGFEIIDILSRAEGIQMNTIQSKALIGIGIGNPPGTMDLRAYLLQKFSVEEQKQIDASLEQAVAAVRTVVLNDFDQHVNRFNLGQKYKYHKV